MKSYELRSLTAVAIMAAVICVVAPFSIPLPFSGVPISFADMVIYLSIMLLGMKRGTMSVAIYLLIGLVGLPVFSSFTGGLSKLAGPTGGYLLGYILLALLSGFIGDKRPTSRPMFLLGMILGTIAMYLAGSIWLSVQAHLSYAAALMVGVVPFIPGDLVKMAIILIIGPAIRKSLKHTGVLQIK